MSRHAVGVIGAGIFGVAAALELRAAGIDVTLYEKRGDILGETTARNFFRLHRGYHYPRSLPTARQAMMGYTPFLGMFAEALTPAVPAHYAIAAEGSLTTPSQFELHCSLLGLSASPITDLPDAGVLVPGSTAACYEVDEPYYDPDLLRRFAWERLNQFGVKVELNWQSARGVADYHDVAVVTAHSALNEVLTELSCAPVELQYELCEVAVIDARLNGLSLVVMDGPFCSIAPTPCGDGFHMLYDVVHSVHARHTGYANPGLPSGPSKFPLMLESARRFVETLRGKVSYVSCLYGERVVLPNVDKTDARPSNMWWAGPDVLAVLSGKVTASVLTGRKIARQVAVKLGVEPPDPALATAPPDRATVQP